MGTSKMQYTIRGIDPELYSALLDAARAKQISLNRFLVDELKRIVMESGELVRHHDLDFAIGSIKDGVFVDVALKQFSLVDGEIWD